MITFATMETFDLHILGCGSAQPTTQRNPSSQVINLRDKLFMVDCGEGAQLEMKRNKLSYARLNHIFLSHLHGDHCLGLIGLISTLGLNDRTAELVIHAHPDAERIFRPMLNYFCTDIPFNVRFNSISPQKSELIFEDRSLQVFSIPLRHRVPTSGFLFSEKATQPHIVPEMTKYHEVPLSFYNRLKAGEDYRREDGVIVPNSVLTRPAALPRRYAYCSDTAYSERIVPLIESVDLLYHESTFMDDQKARAKQTMHSTAKQAATIAKMADVKKLVLGHYSARYKDLKPLLAEAKSIFPNTHLSQDGFTFRI